jgi:cytochrome c peroxidase
VASGEWRRALGRKRCRRACWSAVALAAIACLLLPSATSEPKAQGMDIEALWKARLKRPGLPPPSPPDNPLAPDKAALGARLFADARLSGGGARSCASCHDPARQFTDGRRRALALSGAPLRRNTPALWNLAWGKHFFWDGRAPSLEAQVRMPIDEPQEMGGDWGDILRRLGADADLASRFRAVFPAEPVVSQAAVLQALASYVRSLVSPPIRFDAWVEGDGEALRPAEARGFRLFIGKAGCVLCHVGWRFTDDRFHDIGLAGSDGGRGAVPGGTPGLMAFKTPSLRELAHTAPYMHDGSLATLEAVIAHYTGGLRERPSLATNINRRLRLSAGEKADLIAFLRTLSSEPGPTREQRAGPH